MRVLCRLLMARIQLEQQIQTCAHSPRGKEVAVTTSVNIPLRMLMFLQLPLDDDFFNLQLP